MIYLDYQATTPLAPEARVAMQPYLDAAFGNPHSMHRMGREARAAVELARDRVAALLPAGGRLVFTSGATEALNLALKGRRPRRIVTIATEHAAVLDTARWMAGQGCELIVLPVDAAGLVDPAQLEGAVDGPDVLVAAMLVNNEIGVIQPVDRLAAIAHAKGALMLCDAVQGFGRVAVPDACDMIALSAHKIHGPKGIGALWVRDGLELEAQIHGGGQEGGLRSGTLAPALCAGFGVAAQLMAERSQSDAVHVAALSDAALAALGPGWTVNGSRAQRYRGNLNLRAEGLDVARLMSELRTLAFSAGSACASGSGRPSHVLQALGLPAAAARSSIRIGFGRYTTIEEVETAMQMIRAAADAQRECRL